MVEKSNCLCANSSPDLSPLEEQYVLEALRSGWVSSKGPFIETFEASLANYLGIAHTTVVSSGTAALHLALKAIGVRSGDEVIIPDLTYIAVANAVIYCQAIPVMVDVDPRYWCIDPDAVRQAITPRTKAIIAVHAFGHPVDFDALRYVAEEAGLFMVEDVCQALGARYKGCRVGGLATISIHSFFANKIITTGEGGAIATHDCQLDAVVKSLRNHCESPRQKFMHDSIGFSYRMTNLQAALGAAQLVRVDDLLRKRELVLNWYREALTDIEGLEMNPQMPWAEPVNWQVCVLLQAHQAARLQHIRRRFADMSIEIRPCFVPLSEQHALTIYRRSQQCKVAKALSSAMLMLPISSAMNRDRVQVIAETLHRELL
ncbi:MAG: DegT/DnrJ/EryC1/StrS family aminotransferase [Chitinispirillaceae bacterium]|nr:DegT/DnrJ/EryC1/StrS family aminotransferase [Chitinispirillaceae bacterium]